MSSNDRILAEGVCESICATTPRTHNHHHPRVSRASIFGWAVVAAVALITLAMAGGAGR